MAVTGTLGNFEISFPQLNPGDPVELIAVKQGYKVVNDIQLDREIPRNPALQPVTIILSKDSERDRWAEQFYRLKGREAVETNYAAKVANASAGEFAKLRRERDEAIRQADELAKQLSSPNYASNTDLYKRAARLFLEGNTNEALKTLSRPELSDKANKLKVEAAAMAATFQLKARLHAINLQWRDAAQAYEDTLEFVPKSYSAWFEYGQFLLGRGDYIAAERAFKNSVRLAADAKDPCRIALSMDNLGIVERRMNRLSDASKSLESALRTRRELAAIDQKFQAQLASTLNNIGIAYWASNDSLRAMESLEEAVRLWRQLDGSRGIFASELATAYNNLGVVRRQMGMLDDAESNYNAALSIRREIAKLYGATFLGNVSSTLNNIGALALVRKKYDSALEALTESIEIRRGLIKKIRSPIRLSLQRR